MPELEQSPAAEDECTWPEPDQSWMDMDLARRQQCHEMTITFMKALATLTEQSALWGKSTIERFSDYQLGHCFCESSADMTHHKCCKCGEMVYDHGRKE